MKIMFSETIGQMVDLLHEGSSQVSVSKCLLQLCSGEDFQPRHRVAHEYTACIVGDGHSGNGCTSIIDQNAEAILSAVIQSKDLGIGMNMCQELCKNEKNCGAMVALTLYNKNTRLLEIISVGDILVTVYKDGQLIHKQPIHDCQTIVHSIKRMDELTNCKIAIDSPVLTMVPERCGKTIHLETKPNYFVWENSYKKLAACSFIGHQNSSRLLPFQQSLTVPHGSWHMLMASDGISDMIHPENEILSSFTTMASDIVEAARKRWIQPHFNELPLKYDHYNVDGYFRPNQKASSFSVGDKPIKLHTKNIDGSVFVLFNDGSSNLVDSAEIIERNSGADDLSCLVMKVED